MSIDFLAARQAADGAAPHERRKTFTIEAEAPARLRRYRLPLIAATAVALLSAGVVLWSQPPRIEQRLWTAKVQRGDLRICVSGHGQIVPSALVTLSSTTGGAVAAIHALSGARLAKGDAVLTLRNPDLVAALEAAETTYSQKLAAQASLHAELAAERSQTRMKLDDATDALTVKRLEINAQQALFDSGISTQLALQKERAQLAAAERQVRQSTADLANLDATNRMRMRAADSEVEAAQAQLARVRAQVEELTVRAPEAGTVYELMENVTVGTPVAAGAVVAKVATQATVGAEIEIPSSRAADVVPGQVVELQVGSAIVQGRVERIDPRVQQDQVRVSVALDPRTAGRLMAGQPAKGEIVTASLRNVTYVERPAGAVDGAAGTVFEVDEQQGRLLRREVQFGGSGGKHIVIDSGISAGTEIVLSDMARFADRRIVRYSN